MVMRLALQRAAGGDAECRVVASYPKTETYYPWRDYTPRASQLNIIHLKASVFAVSLLCHP